MANCECHNQMVSIKNGDFMGFSMGFSLNEIVISWVLIVISWDLLGDFVS